VSSFRMTTSQRSNEIPDRAVGTQPDGCPGRASTAAHRPPRRNPGSVPPLRGLILPVPLTAGDRSGRYRAGCASPTVPVGQPPMDGRS